MYVRALAGMFPIRPACVDQTVVRAKANHLRSVNALMICMVRTMIGVHRKVYLLPPVSNGNTLSERI